MVLKTARERWRIKIGKIIEAAIAIAVEIEIIMYQDEEKGVAVIARKEGIIVTINIPIQDMITVIDVIETIDEKIEEKINIIEGIEMKMITSEMIDDINEDVQDHDQEKIRNTITTMVSTNTLVGGIGNDLL